ncbi:MAG: glutamate racemase [Deltaproteobacteria bacterium]|nr:glutamate racemase [Deltaproteobacteria bacterium]MBW1984608.1 glutamate racemase [Deltaproteobacteria bacterium]MBW2181113.1 glutamate racemase [Deltaproteobacteria bacterium]MBW2365903.1 glutamate racemase [Deltaproteobacteria bacterium]
MIGIFDSGIGGLTVASAFREKLQGYDIVYFGDTARTPYGTKSPETVISYSLQNAEFLISQGAKIIVIACNTASSIAAGAIVNKFDIPLFEVITPAVNLSIQASRNFQIGVIGTRATIKSNIYEQKILQANPNARVYSVACPMLVPLVEEGWFKRPETRMIVKKYLHPLKVRKIDTLILGCTHYPLLKNIIQIKIGKRVKVIDSAEGVVEDVKRFLKNNPKVDGTLSKKEDHKIFVSDITEQFEKTAKVTLKRNVTLEHITIS